MMERQQNDVILAINGKKEVFLNQNRIALGLAQEKLKVILRGEKIKKVILPQADAASPTACPCMVDGTD